MMLFDHHNRMHMADGLISRRPASAFIGRRCDMREAAVLGC